MAIGDRIKTIRGELTQFEFAKRIQVDKATVSTWETTNAYPKGDILERIHQEFKVNINWLLTGEGEPHLIKDKSVGSVRENEAPYLTGDELALIRTLRLCGEEYKKRVYIAATIRAQNVIEERKLETQERLSAQKDLEKLSTASIE
jgi:transcriptional regulator with XRE-family HTH domain